MPNYRQKNRKKNNKKNKQNKNNQNQNQNSNKQQQQQGGEEKESPTTTTKTKQNQKQQVAQEQGQKTTKLQHDAHAGNVSNEPTVDNSNKDHVDHIENLRDDDVVPLTSTSNENAAETKVDTVSKENATQKELLVDIDTNNVQTNNMGTKQSKEPQSTNNSIAIEEEEEDQQHAQLCVNENEVKNQQVKVIIHRIVPEIVDEQSAGEMQAQVITHAIAIEEEPEEDDQPENESDNADITTYQVQSPSSNDESFEAANDASHKHTLEIQEIFNEEDEISNAQESEATLSSAAKADDYKLKRAQKRVALETHFLPQLLSPRYLDSILEENSDLSDCSDRPGLLRSLSASSGETEYLQELRSRRANAKFPRSNLDFSKTHKHGDLPNTLPTLPGPISEEPLAMMVEAKLIEQFPDQPQESCTKLTFKHLEESTDTAEVIFINSSTSSSTSDLLELDEQEVEREPINLDTDAHDIINKPADENDLTTCTTERETTPVNNAISTDISSLIASKLETAEVETMNETTNKQAILIGNEEYDHLNNDEQYSQCSTETETIVDVSQASSSGHETSTSEAQPQQKVANNIKSFDDSSVLSTTSISNSSIVDASSVEDSSSSSAEALARLEETCREIMDNVREIVYANANHNNNNNINVNDDVDNLTITTKPQYNGLSYGLPPQNVTYTPYNTNGKQKSPTPPPIPPPPQLDSYTTCNESAYINTNNIHVPPSVANQLPPCSSSRNNGVLERQESADSHCSSSTNQSQCTAINIAQRDIDVSSPIFSDNLAKTTTSTHNSDLMKLKQKNSETIQKLRQLCTQKLATLPYGEQVLVELANLAQNIGKMPMRGEEEIQSNLRELHEMIIGRDEKVQKQVQFVEQKTPSNEIVHKIVYENVRCKEEEADNTMNEALRKRLTPSPPPLPPPPVPMKSSKTVAKAQQHEQQQNSRIIPIVFEQKNDASKEQKTTFTKAYEDDSIEKQQQKQQEQQIKQKAEQFANETTTKTSSVENNSRQTENSYATGKEFKEEKHFSSSSSNSTETKSSTSFSNNFPLKTPRPLGDMPGVESEIGRMFPNLGSANIFDDNQKRFSNIEGNTRNMFPGNTPKRYSNIETSSYEAQKRIENGQVVYDYENKQHETVKDGDEVDASMLKNANKIQHDIQTHDTQKVPENMRSTFNLNEHLQTTKNTTNSSTSKPSIDDEKKLFKDFDELSQQLHHELETGRQQREEREKSASLFDLSRTHMKQQLEELKKQRQAHLNELEREIQRSMKSRESRREQLSEQQQQHNVHEIPIKLEGLSAGSKTKENEFQHDVNSAFRRSESLFNLNNTNQQPDAYVRPRTASSNYEVQQQQLLSDDWSQYNSDVGSSENISRPFARETQVCYQRMSPRPREIRAPRLTVSSHDLSSTPTFDPLNAYNVPRTKRTPSTSLYSLYEGDTEQRQQSTQCYSVLQRDPNPTYIGTTSRRGVSPAPQQPTNRPQPAPRRASLPREIHEQQLKYITSKEEELRLEFERLQNERRRLLEELQNEQAKAQPVVQPQVPPRTKLNYRAAPRLPTLSEDEVLRQQMAEEWLNKVAEREERRSQKTIKISKIQEEQLGAKQYMEDMHHYSSLKPDLSQEFLERVKERRHKLHMPADSDWESGAESQPNKAKTQGASVPEIKVISGKSVADVQNLPQHLKEFAHYTNQETEQLENGGKRSVFEEEERRQEATPYSSSSATKKSTVATTYKVSRVPPQTLAPGQESINRQETLNMMFQPVPYRKSCSMQTQINDTSTSIRPRKKTRFQLEPMQRRSWSESDLLREIDKELKLAKGFLFADENAEKSTKAMFAPKFKAKAPSGAGVWTPTSYSASSHDLRPILTSTPTPPPVPGNPIWTPQPSPASGRKQFRPVRFESPILQRRYVVPQNPLDDTASPRSATSCTDFSTTSTQPRNDSASSGSTVHAAPSASVLDKIKTFEKSASSTEIYRPFAWPQIHASRPICKPNEVRRPYKSNGYQSEPEPNYDSDQSTIKYRTLDRRRLQSCSSNVNVRNNTNSYPDDSCYGTLPNPVKSSHSAYKNQPGRIEDYVTGRSSISEKEKKEWWDEVMDIFNGSLDQAKLSPRYAEGNLSRALAKDSGYTSDSNLVFRKKVIPQASGLSPVEQKQAYKSVQAGGEPPLFGFRKPAPEKPKESPNRYFESDVNIHYKAPVRNEYRPQLSEEELALRQSEHMQKLYQEERRRKYLLELQDMNARRHTDNFSPSQKSPIPLNRYDDFQADLAPKSPNFANKLKMVVRALYNFQGQNPRELSFKKGDIIYVRRQIDKNWFEGEFNAMIGLFPANYVEILSKDGANRPPITKRPSEGQARAKYNFQAQSGVELSLNKGELVALTRRVDDNWFEGRIANRKGIFPVSYVEVLTDIGAEDIAAKTVVPTFKPNLDALRTEVNNEFNKITRNGHHPPNGILKETKFEKMDVLHVETHNDPISYRALYKYRPQNSDELELFEGDIVHVLEKCDDGWFVGTSQRTGCFGTFPGNYVERV